MATGQETADTDRTVKFRFRGADAEWVTAATNLPLPRLTSHRYSAPTATDFREALRSTAELEVEALWEEIAGEAGVSPGAHLLTIDQMDALAEAVAARPGPLGLLGRALIIRVATYRALSELRSGALPADWSRRSMESLLRGRLPDAARLAAIDELDLFTPESRARLDAAAARAAARFGTQVGLVSLVLDGAQAFAGSHGLGGWMAEVGGTPVEWSLCATTVRTREPFVVPDGDLDAMHRTNPMIEKDGVRSYAGAPMITSDGHVLGAFCVIDSDAHTYSDEDIADLQAMADAVVEELERASGTARQPT